MKVREASIGEKQSQTLGIVNSLECPEKERNRWCTERHTQNESNWGVKRDRRATLFDFPELDVSRLPEHLNTLHAYIISAQKPLNLARPEAEPGAKSATLFTGQSCNWCRHPYAQRRLMIKTYSMEDDTSPNQLEDAGSSL